MINKEAGMGTNGQSSKILKSPTSSAAVPKTMVVAASAPGLQAASVSVSLSTNEEDSVLQVAERSVASAYIGD